MTLARCIGIAPAEGYTQSHDRPSVKPIRIPTAATADSTMEQKYLQNTTIYAVDRREVLLGAVGIHPMAVDNSWRYRPHRTPQS